MMRFQFKKILFGKDSKTGAELKPQKRIMAVHDLSCFGKCSLTVVLPILSAAGVETSVIPTAVLSTHTGGFTNYTCRDLTGEIPGIQKHWKSLGLKFDGIYTGYLGSFEQLQLVCGLIDDFRNENTLVLVDPVMADNGKLYANFDPEFPSGMKKLCSKANVIVPNLTEASLLLNEPYLEGPYKRVYIDGILKKLGDLGPRKIVLTGISFDETHLGAAAYDRMTGEIDYVLSERVQGYYHGTGDIFASALLAALMNDFPLAKAVRIAIDFTVGSIQRTAGANTDFRFGVNFEAGIPGFVNELKLLN